MSKGKLGKARCCPWCGTATLERDYFNTATTCVDSCVSYICVTCCTGFSIRESPRASFVNRMYAVERKQRPPDEHHKGGGQIPLTERPLPELLQIETLLKAKRPRNRSDRERVGASLAAVRKAIQERGNAEQLESPENSLQGDTLVEARETQRVA